MSKFFFFWVSCLFGLLLASTKPKKSVRFTDSVKTAIGGPKSKQFKLAPEDKKALRAAQQLPPAPVSKSSEAEFLAGELSIAAMESFADTFTQNLRSATTAEKERLTERLIALREHLRHATDILFAVRNQHAKCVQLSTTLISDSNPRHTFDGFRVQVAAQPFSRTRDLGSLDGHVLWMRLDECLERLRSQVEILDTVRSGSMSFKDMKASYEAVKRQNQVQLAAEIKKVLNQKLDNFARLRDVVVNLDTFKKRLFDDLLSTASDAAKTKTKIAAYTRERDEIAKLPEAAGGIKFDSEDEKEVVHLINRNRTEIQEIFTAFAQQKSATLNPTLTKPIGSSLKPPPSLNSSSGGNGASLSPGVIVGIVLGTVAVLGGVGAFFYRRRKLNDAPVAA